MGVLDDSGDGKGRSVGLGLEQPLEDDLVELGISSSSKEAVKLEWFRGEFLVGDGRAEGEE